MRPASRPAAPRVPPAARPDSALAPTMPCAALAATVLGYTLITLDALVITVALPAIRDDLGSGMTGLQWVVDSYALMFAGLLLSAGSLADRVGARRAFGAGLGVFVVASVACGLAPVLPALIAARVLQGTGAAIIVPASLALVRQAFPEAQKRARAVSLWSLGGSLGTALGPVVGGLLVQWDWRMIFFVNVPLGVVILALLSRVSRSSRRDVPFDWLGQITGVALMGGFTYGVIEAGAKGFAASGTLAAFAVAVAALAGFWLAESRSAHPMLPLSLVRNRSVLAASAVGFANNAGFYGMIFLASLYVQQQRGFGSLSTGFTFVPVALVAASCNAVADRVATRLGRLRAICLGMGCTAVSLVLFVLAPTDVSLWLLALALVPSGIGGGLAVPALTSMLLDGVPAGQSGVASGFLNTMRQFAGAIAVAIFGALVAAPHSFVSGMRVGMLIGVGVIIVLTSIAVLLLRNTARKGARCTG